MTDAVAEAPKASINTPAVIMFSISTVGALTVLPWYAWSHHLGAGPWIFFAFTMWATGLSITAGYHRLWSHRAYEAHWTLRLFYMLFGAMSLQNSTLIWASMHRVHHKNVDDIDNDPYSIKRGFWYAHMGWMLRNYPSSALDFSNARDLQQDPLVAFQHRHYLGLALGMNIAFPALVGAAFDDPWGFMLIGGLLRLVVNHHLTFFINSLAHYWGRRPYTADNTARDNDIIALFTYGEGYHNFHHLFQWDYRNGVRWWQFDPTKWWIAGWSAVGVTRGLRRVPEFKIQRAMLQRQFERTQEKLRACSHPGRLAELQKLFEHEMEAFSVTLNEWKKLQAERIDAARKQIAGQWEHSEARRRFQALEHSLRLQRRRVRLLRLQTA
ncbi:acyl-CoA desaturase [Nevskia soli]|uniref:acyl-CoA desaturase n=1 Tax=Nevskia soli TaxID=418856 RepID=UPI0004A7707A|nr:fatty acid desaturase [Nevskia soli]